MVVVELLLEAGVQLWFEVQLLLVVMLLVAVGLLLGHQDLTFWGLQLLLLLLLWWSLL